MKRMVQARTVQPSDLAGLVGPAATESSLPAVPRLRTLTSATTQQAPAASSGPQDTAKSDLAGKSSTQTAPRLRTLASATTQQTHTASNSLQDTLNSVARSSFDMRRACNAMTNMSALIAATALNRNEIDVPFLLESAQKVTTQVLAESGESDNPASVATVMKAVVHALEELCRRDDTTTDLIESHLEMIGKAIITIAKHPATTASATPQESFIDLSSDDSINCSMIAASSALATFAVDVGLEPAEFIKESMSLIVDTAKRNTEDMRDVYAQSQSTRIFFQCVLRELTTLYITTWRMQLTEGMVACNLSLDNVKSNANARFAAIAGEVLLAATAGKSHAHSPRPSPAPVANVAKGTTLAGNMNPSEPETARTAHSPKPPALKRLKQRIV